MKRHELDPVSLIAGAVFALVAVAHLVAAETGEYLDVGWLVPVVLVGLGVAGLAGALRATRSEDQHALADEPTDPASG